MLERLLDGSLMPHGHCLLWREDLLFLHLSGDILTFVAYASIPAALIYMVRKRADLHINSFFILFAAFIAFCGITHAISMLNIWYGYYFIEGLAKFFTGIISILTAIMFWRLMPTIMAIPSSKILAQRNDELLQMQRQLRQANNELEKNAVELRNLASTDTLTGLHNRRLILKLLSKDLEISTRYNRELSLLMVDIDHFKNINDKYGHQMGDHVLSLIAKKLEDECRQTDLVGRYGGEEFLIILPETNQQAAIELAERVRNEVNGLDIGLSIAISCSIGVTSLIKGDSITTLIKRADDALYQAKDQGRNRVVSA
ncbi:GGDEF domain-containing protein [Dasania sp. GY-MA-18]|uniref:diguanylate cyclase n=1 Tax=Dasania phycosphaerae TaxID=2950436 RepID=A0A9J6RK96_9GAMM|nr:MULTISPECIES: GGDEF domain-containing protein [Dasania]MCR8922479.1 GGDEF domain-containing protein [Dasania sp. GY-MA-18]MCZ0864907.1 GGDEF domain-containing protein [Dasania phycosphaerae]MCZ0868635.1 GGDEF domain-containing protein [Dasania phycosphaerae]